MKPSKKIYGPEIKKSENTIMHGTANENAADICRTCKRSDIPRGGLPLL